jgi:cytochrome c oxidase assembly protein subunit 11
MVREGMPWKFVPSQSSIYVTPGEPALAFYKATNLSSAPITGIANYNVVPFQVDIYSNIDLKQKAGYYFMKIQCFCFEEQKLDPGETVDMPVFFYLDPDILDDKYCKDISSLVLSYTFFKTNSAK